ncbi:hypothetical protein LJC32_02990 [Oscillospiraceae bacterium OttesenSCG-928-F05]|nr:hypothetical protein [Oscillospiraceae bacterium OttesenSCG-928-F05]
MAEKLFNIGKSTNDRRLGEAKAKQETREYYGDLAQSQIAAAKENPAEFQAYLDTAALVPRFSPNNIALVMAQTRDWKEPPRMLFSAKHWGDRGRSVTDRDGGVQVFVGYDLGELFDISQTRGPDIPPLDLKTPEETVVAIQGLFDNLPQTVALEDMPGSDGKQPIALYKNEIGRDAALYSRAFGPKEVSQAFFETCREVFHARNNKYSQNGPYHNAHYAVEASCAAYILCKRYGIEMPLLNFEALGAFNKKMDTVNFRNSLDIVANQTKEMETAIYRALAPERTQVRAPRRDQKFIG